MTAAASAQELFSSAAWKLDRARKMSALLVPPKWVGGARAQVCPLFVAGFSSELVLRAKKERREVALGAIAQLLLGMAFLRIAAGRY